MPELVRDRYEVLGVAGRGGQGEVLRARDRQHDRVVALKVRAIPDGPARDSVLSEARILLGLRPHPNLPLMREDFFDGDRYVMVSDWVEGTSLQAILDERGDPGLPPTSVLSYLADVAGALDHLHAHAPAILHHDVKPANLILRPDGRTVLVDFGISSPEGHAPGMGSHGYMAPEVAAGSPPTTASDVYSLGSTAFALLSGGPPVAGRPSWEGLAPADAAAIERVLRRALATDPLRRPGSARELVEMLRGRLSAALPSGTVTFLLTDIEGSTSLWERHPEEMADALARHDRIVAECVERARGKTIKSRGEGDSTFNVFADAADAVTAAGAMQLALAREPWPEPIEIRVRAAVHTGEAQLRGGDYYGSTVNRCARLRAVAYGGQTLVSGIAAELSHAPSLLDLGELRLKDLQGSERVFQLLVEGMPAEFPPLRSAGETPNNLPAQLTTFIGRAADVQEILASLERARLVTLAGMGGTGKTRLALRVADDMVERAPDGVWFVELASLADGSEVAQRVATTVGARPEPGEDALAALARTFGAPRALVIMDNCEHVLEPCAVLVDALLRACPELRVVATSRETLGVTGEHAYAVRPLPADGDAVTLFVERARLVRSSFELTPQNSAAVRSICARLDGIPLAIELAAARTSVLSPEGIDARLDDALRLLTSRDRAAMPRQQTLRALVDWSYDLLGDDERALFARLSAFAGGFTLEAVERVCAGDGIDELDVLDLLTMLVHRSLVGTDDEGDEIRYSMLETLRQYGDEKLAAGGEQDAVRARHAACYAELVARAELGRAVTGSLLDSLERELPNIRKALEHDIEADVPRGIDTMSNASQLLILRGYAAEGRRWMQRLLERATGDAEVARASNLLGVFAFNVGDIDVAAGAYERCLALARDLADVSLIADAEDGLAMVSYDRGDVEAAVAHARRALELRLPSGSDALSVDTLTRLAVFVALAGDVHEAEALITQAVERARPLADPKRLADALSNASFIAYRKGALDEAEAADAEVLRIRRELGDRWGVANSLMNLASLAVERQDREGARARFLEAREILESLKDQRGLGQIEEWLQKI